MRIARSVEHKVNMGNYESVTIGCCIDGEVMEDADEEVVISRLNELVQLAVADDLKKARKATVNDDSYVNEWRI
jgi:hypothetical protein